MDYYHCIFCTRGGVRKFIGLGAFSFGSHNFHFRSFPQFFLFIEFFLPFLSLVRYKNWQCWNWVSLMAIVCLVAKWTGAFFYGVSFCFLIACSCTWRSRWTVREFWTNWWVMTAVTIFYWCFLRWMPDGTCSSWLIHFVFGESRFI